MCFPLSYIICNFKNNKISNFHKKNTKNLSFSRKILINNKVLEEYKFQKELYYKIKNINEFKIKDIYLFWMKATTIQYKFIDTEEETKVKSKIV